MKRRELIVHSIPQKPPKEPESGNVTVPIYMTVGRQHNERLNTLTNQKRQTVTPRTHADILPGLRVIQDTYPLIEASRTLHHVTSLDDRRRVCNHFPTGRMSACVPDVSFRLFGFVRVFSLSLCCLPTVMYIGTVTFPLSGSLGGFEGSSGQST
jgi:hypothetical protein